MTEDELDKALRQPTPIFAAEALEYAMANAEVSSRVSHRILAEAVAAARDGRLHDLGFGPIYAAFLLGHHRDHEAFDRLAEIARLPSAHIDDILGDAVTEDMCAILWSVCAGDGSRLLALVDDPATDTYWQSAALRAISIGVAECVLDREEMLRELRHRLERDIAAERPADTVVGDTATWLVAAITNLGGGDEPSLLDLAYEKGLVDGFFIDPEAWHSRAPTTEEAVIDGIRQRDGWRFPVKPLDLRKWGCFSKPRPSRPVPRGQRSAKAAARTKTKAQRKARKRNRGRKR